LRSAEEVRRRNKVEAEAKVKVERESGEGERILLNSRSSLSRSLFILCSPVPSCVGTSLVLLF
jgi:hypothetical protein